MNFNRKLKVEFHGAKITSDAGLLAYREMDDAMGLTEMSVEDLADYRTGKNTQHTLLGMFRQAVSWDLPRRVVAKVEGHNGELFPRIGFIITNMTGRPNKIVRFYNRRGTAEQMDQGRQERREVDKSFLQELPGQSGTASAFRFSIQSWELPQVRSK